MVMPIEAVAAGGEGFGRRLRDWRGARQLSQLGLALAAGTSARHMSFLETGRASPSRAMVLRLGEVLDLPLRARNELLVAAGYAPLFRERPLSEPVMAEARRALEHILEQQEPFPAIVVDRFWNVVLRNAASHRMRRAMLDPVAIAAAGEDADNAMKAMFHPLLYRRVTRDWEALAAQMLLRLAHEAAAPDGAATAELLRAINAYPDVPAPAPPGRALPPNQPLMVIRMERGPVRLHYFSTIATFGTPQDVTLQELRIKSFFPADAETEQVFRRLAEAG